MSDSSTTIGGGVALALAAGFAAIDGPMSSLGLLTVAGGWVAGGAFRAWLDRRRTVRVETRGFSRRELQAIADQFAAERKHGEGWPR